VLEGKLQPSEGAFLYQRTRRRHFKKRGPAVQKEHPENGPSTAMFRREKIRASDNQERRSSISGTRAARRRWTAVYLIIEGEISRRRAGRAKGGKAA